MMELRDAGKLGRQSPESRRELVRDPAKASRKRRTLFALLALAALAGCAAITFDPALGAGPKGKADNKGKADPKGEADADNVKEAIKKNGRLPAGAKGADYWRHSEALHKGKKKTVAAPTLHKDLKAHAQFTGKGHALVTVGEPPPGFGKGFVWDRTDQEVMLVMFVNAADPLGVSVEGVEAGDQVQVLSASGIASFSSDKGNPLASSIVGLVAAGAKVAVGAAGAPEVAPAIDAAEQFAKDQFKATNSRKELRDAFGVEASSGKKARQEGGLLVCMPEAGGTFYSGDDKHKDRWVQKDGTRQDENLPAHFNNNAFFPRQGYADHNTRVARGSGPMYVLAWDWQFDDNAGFYKVFVKLTKGNGPPPVIIERKDAKPKR